MGKGQGQDRLFGHYHGVESVRNVVEACAELGVGYLTLYAFSTENWERPEQGSEWTDGITGGYDPKGSAYPE